MKRFLGVFLAVLSACASVQVGELDDFQIVDCEVTGAILKVGSNVSVGRGALLRTSLRDCDARRGVSFIDQTRTTSLRLWLPLAQDGDQQAQLYVGHIYEKGMGQEPDYAKAAEWYRKAADQGFAPAQTALAILYERGQVSGKAEPQAALTLYRKAAQLTEELAFQRDVAARDEEIAALKRELEQAREEAKKRREELQQQGKQLSGQIETLRRQLAQARAARDAEKIKQYEQSLRDREEQARREQAQLAASDAEAGRAEAALQALEGAPRSTSADPQAPEIQLLEPQSIAMRGVTTIRVRPDLKEVPVVARVTATAPLARVTLNDREVKPDKDGLVKGAVPVAGRTTAVQIIAIDSNGRRSALPFVMAAADLIQEPARAAAPAATPGKYYALVIGNANYKQWEPLKSPINDARAVANLLRGKYGFEVKLITDATRQDMFREFARLRSVLTERDNLLVYYSGHGNWDKANLRGYWVPVDGGTDSVANHISSSDITDQISVLRAKQVLVVVDACYSGVLVGSVADQLDRSPNAGRDAWIAARAQLRSRKVMSSGNVRPVMDGGANNHSIFARQFLDALQRRTEPFEAYEIHREIAPRVERAARGLGTQQEPQYGQLRFSGHTAGDFVFLPRG